MSTDRKESLAEFQGRGSAAAAADNGTHETVPPAGDQTLAERSDYFRYLYDQELARTVSLNAAGKTYLVFLTSTITLVLAGLKWVSDDPDALGAVEIKGSWSWTIAVTLGLGLVLLIAAFVLTTLALKTRTFERLCRPVDFALASESMDSRQFQYEVISNYAVATERNFAVNSRKAAFLARALLTYLAAVAALSGCAFIYLLSYY